MVRPRVVIGVDTHLNTHTAVALDQLGHNLDHLVISTDPSGYRRLLDWALRIGAVESFGLEGTGSFGAGLSRFLVERGYKVIEVNRPNRKARRMKGKSDPLDAEQAARQVQAGTASALPKSQDAEVEALRALRVPRASAVKANVQATNGLKSLVMTAPAELRESLRNLTTTRLVNTCAGFRPGECNCPTAATKLAMKLLARRIKDLESEVKTLDGQIGRLVNLVAPELIELFGVGPEVASTILVSAGDNPSRLQSEAAFANLCGVAPIPASSGKTNRHRLSRAGDRKANSALYRIVVVRLRFHDATKRYMEKRTAEGKSKKEIIRCLKRYVAREVFAVLMAVAQRRALPA